MHRNEWNLWQMSFSYTFFPESFLIFKAKFSIHLKCWKKQYMSAMINELQNSKYFINLFVLVIPRKTWSILNVEPTNLSSYTSSSSPKLYLEQSSVFKI